MNEIPGQTPRDDNPFFSAAVARPREFDDSTVSISTPAITEAVSVVDDFLHRSARSAGAVLAIEGEYGTGKSHLVGALLHHIHGLPADRRPRYVYLEARPATFVELYRQLVKEELTKDDVSDRVREFYADVLADALGGSEFTSDIAQGLKRGELDPVEVSDRLNLMESRHLERLQRLLESVTRKAAFGIVLPLLLRPQFADAAWEWLSGHQPDQVLVDRGIDGPIGSEELALEAMGVLALLYSQRGRQFVLAIDEMDKVVSARRKPSENAVDAFRKMLEVITGARALLVLAGLPEYLEELGAAVRQRVGKIIRVSPLTGDDAIEYIRRSQARIGRGFELRPFTEETVRYLVKINDGNPRRIIRLCSHLYRRAMDDSPRNPARAVVTPAMVRSVAREQTGASTADHVRNEIRQVFSRLGLGYQRDHFMDSETDSRADYWVPYDSADGAGCALLLKDNVLTETDRDSLVGTATFIQSTGEGVEAVLIVVGLLNSDYVPTLNAAFSVEPIVYDQYTFSETLSSVLERQLNQLDHDGYPAKLDEQFGRLSKQQANTQRMLEQTLKTMSALRSASDRSFVRIQREVAELGDAVRVGADADHEVVVPLRLPPAVAAIFTTAQSSLEGLVQVGATIRAMFAAAEDADGAVDARLAVRSQIRSQHVFPAMGVAAMLRTLLAAFRDGVNEWYRSYVPSATGQPHQTDRERLDALCRAYETVYEYIPFFRLEELEQFTPYVIDDSASAAIPEPRLAEAHEVFNRLSVRVHTAVLESVADGR